MLIWITIKLALRSLWTAKLRSFLAILGIIMGVGAVISMLSIVEGAKRQMQGMIGSLGTDVLYIWPDYRSVQGKGSAPVLKLEDARAVLADATSVLRVSPMVEANAAVKYGNKNTRVTMDGVATSYLAIRNMELQQGRFFTEGEVQQGTRVAVLGPKTAEKLFGKQDPLDQMVKVNQLIFRVVGVLKARGSQGMGNEDDRMIAPYTTVRNQVAGRRANLGSICVQATATADLQSAEDQVRGILRKQHHLKADAKDDFAVLNQAQLLEMQNKAVQIFSIVLGGVGGICLFTGGIGIMNIMLVIVTERTREIGLRKAVGARNRDILRQFLLEAVLISVMGGLVGVLGGAGLSGLITLITPLKTSVAPQAVVLALSFAAGIGIFFGYYPALRAAKLDPIVALHTE